MPTGVDVPVAAPKRREWISGTANSSERRLPVGSKRQGRRHRTVTGPLGAVGGLAVAIAAVASVGEAQGNATVAFALLIGMTVSYWLPVGWVEVEDATHTVTVSTLWIAVAAVLLPMPLVVVLGALAHGAGWVLTCTFGNGVHRPPLNLDAGMVNTSLGALVGLAAAGAARPFGGGLTSVAFAVVAAVTAASLIVSALDAYFTESSMVRLWARYLREAAPKAALEIIGAYVMLVSVTTFGPGVPAAVGSGLVVVIWRQAASLHQYRTVTAALLELATSATSATSVEDVRALVAEAGRGILGRVVELAHGEHADVEAAVATEPVGSAGWELRVGHGAVGRPFGAGPREQRALTGLAAAAEVALLAARSREEIRTQATHDKLTGLLNRRGFDDEGSRVVERAGRDGRSTTVAYIDLNGFKKVNDTLGHDAGDEVIAAVGDALKTHLRPGDVVGRMGGDEFAVVFGDEIDERGARERVATALADLPHGVGGSIGTASGTTTGLATLVKEADEEMYGAKRASRPTPSPKDRPEA